MNLGEVRLGICDYCRKRAMDLTPDGGLSRSLENDLREKESKVIEGLKGEVIEPPNLSIGLKFDTGKPRMDLLPADALYEVAKILTGGAEKYAPWNWAKGMNWSRLEAAVLRHWRDYQKGNDIDEDSKQLALAHMACDILFLLEYTLKGWGTDDRHKASADPERVYHREEKP